MVGALDQQTSEVDVASLGDAKLRVPISGLAASRPQAEIAAHIPASLEAFLAAQRQNVCQCRQLADAVDWSSACVSGYSVSVSRLMVRSYCWIFTVIAAICSRTGPSA